MAMTQITLPWILFCTALLACWWLWWRSARIGQLWRAAEASTQAAREGEGVVTRTLQLFSHELQSLALTLRGHADHLAAERHANAASLAVATAQLGSLADELGHHLIPAGHAHRLEDEPILLAELVEEAVASMAAAISPGRRNWRVSPGSAAPVTLWADRRAMRLVLMRVLGEAVRSSAHQDWIDIGWLASLTGLAIRVEDEGAGTALPGAPGSPLGSRGIGLRLSLARSLIQAHGGFLDVEARAGVGTGVTIRLPGERLRGPQANADGTIPPEA
jgi:cell cycle sensor histidine kinase DivJ